MTDLMMVRPADLGAIIRDPATGYLLPDDGAIVPVNPYWVGLKMRGDVVPVEDKAVAKPSKPKEG